MTKSESYRLWLEQYIPRDIQIELNKQIPKELYKLINKKIHLRSKQGIYTVLRLVPNGMILTCGTWRYSNHKERLYPFEDFKCLAGGKWNK